MTVCSDILTVDKVPHAQFRQRFRLRNDIQGITRGSKHRGYLPGPVSECFDGILAMIEQYPRKGVINPVVDVIAFFALPLRNADDFSDQCGRRRHQEAARFSQDLYVLRDKAVQLRTQNPRQFAERPDMPVIPAGNPPPMSSSFKSNPRAAASSITETEMVRA